MTPVISIIVAVYKAESCLRRCVDSLLAQTFQDYEIFKSREMLLEWCPKNVHKATGLEALAAILGL